MNISLEKLQWFMTDITIIISPMIKYYDCYYQVDKWKILGLMMNIWMINIMQHASSLFPLQIWEILPEGQRQLCGFECEPKIPLSLFF